LIRNAPAISSLISGMFSDAKNAFEDYTFLRGNGVGKPLGLVNSPGRKNVARASASDITYADVLNMLSSVNPAELSECFWIANVSTMTKIMSIKDTGNNNIFWGGYGSPISGAMPSRLANLELRWTGRTPTIGNAGDLILVNPKYYLVKDGSGPFIGTDESLYRLTGKTVVYFFWNVDGQLWCREPLTLEDGTTTVSPAVVLN
jgi:HK97 family phage major capsid protein